MTDALERAAKEKSKCTLADKYLERCHHMNPNSLKAHLIVKYCLGEYEKCEIYQEEKDEAKNP